MAEITWDKSLNETVLPVIQQRLSPFFYLIPGWCQNLVVFYEIENPEGFTLSCFPSYHYRYIHINVYPSFFDDPQWSESVIHELQHGLLAPLTSKIETAIKYFIQDERLSAYLLKDILNEEESVAQDLAFMIQKLDANSVDRLKNPMV